jgi:hypothetical protein
LSALLEKHLPTGSPVQVPQDNFFPLLQENQRSVLLNVRDMAIADIKDPSVRKVHRSAGPNCGAKDYTYFLHNTVTRIDATARGAGFGNASFEWLLNGQLLTKTGAWTDATIEVQLSDSSPDPADRPFTSVLQVRYLITQSWNKSSLSVQNANSPGNCDLSFIAVALEEGIVGEHGAQTKKEHPFVSRWYEMDAAFFNDAYICHPHPILQIVGDTAGVGTQLSILKTLPDPGPDDIRQLGALSASIERTLDTLTSGNRGLRQAILSAARAVAPAHEVVTEELLLASRAEKKSIVGPVRFGGAIPGSPEIPIYDTAADVSLLAAESAALNGGDEWVPPVAVIGG